MTLLNALEMRATEIWSTRSMRRACAAVVAGASLLAGCARGVHPAPPMACVAPDRATLDSIIRIESSDGSASGVVIGQNLVLTVAHALVDGKAPQALVGGRIYRTVVLAVDEANDLALLRTQTEGLKPVSIIPDALALNEQVWAVGFPQPQTSLPGAFPERWPRITTHGRFETLATDGTVFSTAPVDVGASGGGLMRCHQGEFSLAGVVSGFVVDRLGSGYVNTYDLSTAVPATYIRSFVQANGVAL